MKKLKPLLQLLLGIAILLALLLGVDKASILAEFAVDPVSVGKDAVYAATVEDTAIRFLVLSPVNDATALRAIRLTGRQIPVPPSGTLELVTGNGPRAIPWTAASTRSYGRQLLLDTLRSTASRWHFLVLGILGFIAAIGFCVLRWGVLLRTQGFEFSFGRMLSLYFIGQFFNSFLLGGVSGDLVKAYYVVGETSRKRTEAVATIFIDRALGFVALVVLTVTVMCARLGYFMGDPRLRVALVVNLFLLAGAAAMLAAALRKDILERPSAMRLIEKHPRIGDAINRVHTAFNLCVKSPRVLLLTLGYSFANHIAFIVCTAACLGMALGIDLSIVNYLAVFPVINAVAAIPLTPGGLGTRDGAAVYLLGAMGVLEAKAILLSLLIYIAMLFWSLVGGVVYMFYRRGHGLAQGSGVGGQGSGSGTEGRED